LCEVNNVCKKFFDSVKTSQSQKGVRNMGTLRYCKSQNWRNQGFSKLFNFFIEGSGYLRMITDPDPGGRKRHRGLGPERCSLDRITSLLYPVDRELPGGGYPLGSQR
jgi:hypothetical protein